MAQRPRLREVEIAGFGITAFGKHLDRDLGSLAVEAVDAALADAAMTQDDVEQVVYANVSAGVLWGQEGIRGQVALKGTRLAGLPLYNTENACASGTSALHLAWLAVGSGQVDAALAVGAEKLHHPDHRRSFDAIRSATDITEDLGDGVEGGSVAMGEYARAARRYAAEHGDITAALAAIAVKNRAYAGVVPHAHYRQPISEDDVLSGRLVADPLRLLMCAPFTDGAAAVVLRAVQPGSRGGRPRVRVAATASVTAAPSGPVVRRVVDRLYGSTGLDAHQIDVFQLHDASAYAELIQYEQIGIAEPGKAAQTVLDGQTGPGGDFPTNTDGGLLSRGHPLGATGLAQVGELVRQLRQEAAGRQVPGARRALAVNCGGWMADDYATAFATLLTTKAG